MSFHSVVMVSVAVLSVTLLIVIMIDCSHADIHNTECIMLNGIVHIVILQSDIKLLW